MSRWIWRTTIDEINNVLLEKNLPRVRVDPHAEGAYLDDLLRSIPFWSRVKVRYVIENFLESYEVHLPDIKEG